MSISAKHLITIAILSLTATLAKAQYALVEADKAFEQYNFGKAIDLYEQAFKKKASLHAAQRLATAYGLRSNYKETESWAAIAASMPNSSTADQLNYASALRSNSKFEEAKTQFLKYAKLSKELSTTERDIWLKSCDSAIAWLNKPRPFNIKNEKELNSPQSDWGAFYENNSIVFASDRGFAEEVKTTTKKPFIRFDGAKGPNKGVYTWTGNHYLRIYIKRGNDSVVLYPINAGTDYHVGPASFNAANDEAYFTVTRLAEQLDFKKDNLLKTKLATVRVEIFSLTKNTKTGIWNTAPTPFKYNKVKQYSVADPFISADGQSLYFASNMAGGKGGMDLYVCHRAPNGEWGKPINLESVNTSGNERCPSIGFNGNFYFASDGRVGMGGLDIYRAKITGDELSDIENLQYPINSPQDDFSLHLLTETTGFFSSNRFGGMGSDDIYSFSPKANENYKLSGTVYNQATNQPLANALVKITSKDEAPTTLLTDAQGNYQFTVTPQASYWVNVDKTDFRSDATEIVANTSTQIVNFYLQPIEINKAIRLENIYYDFDKHDIRPDAAEELDKLVKIMQDNPTIWIELSSHTDSRGKDKYNLQLSQRRATAAVQYIIDKGIAKNRIEAVGYGERQLLNHCTEETTCTEEQHQLNRRTTFTILKQ